MKLSLGVGSLSAAIGGVMTRLGDVTNVRVPSFRRPALKFGRSKYMPHIGAKEQERAKRCYMVDLYPSLGQIDADGYYVSMRRCSPTMCQMSKRDFNNPLPF
jgi:hypothetical protein